jgi:hypothetical protein
MRLLTRICPYSASAQSRAARLHTVPIADLVVGGWLIDHLIAGGYDETPSVAVLPNSFSVREVDQAV